MNIDNPKLRKVALETTTELVAVESVAIEFLKIKLLSNLVNHTYVNDVNSRGLIDKFIATVAEQPKTKGNLLLNDNYAV